MNDCMTVEPLIKDLSHLYHFSPIGEGECSVQCVLSVGGLGNTGKTSSHPLLSYELPTFGDNAAIIATSE